MSRDREDTLLRQSPLHVKERKRGEAHGLRAVVRLGEPSKLSEVLARIAGNESIKDDPVIPAGTWAIILSVDIKQTSR